MIFPPSSPSLVALELDSEEDGAESKSPHSSDVEKGEDKPSDDRPPADLTCTRSQSASACEPVTKVRTAPQTVTHFFCL